MTNSPLLQHPTLTARQVATAQTELRAALGLPPEEFSVPDFIGMVSDEIEQLRARGFTDTDIAKILLPVTRIEISAEDIALYYAPPAARGRPG